MSALTGRSIVVTGASTGIGEACARYFDEQGAVVLAGVRREADAERLRDGSSDRLRPLLLDVTDADQIEAAFAEVADVVGPAGLDGLVNNAGVARGGPLEHLPIDEWRDQFEINVFGQVAVTRAAIPLVRAASGRIVFIGSIAGRVSTPFMGPYAASKHAIAAVAEALGHELKPWGIKVSLVEPGVIATAIWGKGRETLNRLDDELPPEAHELYGEVFEEFRASIDKSDASGIPAVEVAKKVEHALTAARPRPRYLVGTDARVAGFADRLLPDQLMEVMVDRFG
jgi:NAD(P)-dependent dehydrogenase (short-subunit alcohol dehydrogenase family)